MGDTRGNRKIMHRKNGSRWYMQKVREGRAEHGDRGGKEAWPEKEAGLREVVPRRKWAWPCLGNRGWVARM